MWFGPVTCWSKARCDPLHPPDSWNRFRIWSAFIALNWHFWSCATGIIDMKSKEISMPVKEAIIALKKENKSLREIAKTLGVAKSTIWYILKKKECTGELGNVKRPGRPRKTPKEDDGKILSLVKKNGLTTSRQFRKTLEEVGAPMSKSTIKKCLDQCKVGSRIFGQWHNFNQIPF